MKQHRRTITLVSEQPDTPKSKARLFAFGLEAIAAAVGCHQSTVTRHIQAKKLDPTSLQSVVTWISSNSSNP